MVFKDFLDGIKWSFALECGIWWRMVKVIPMKNIPEIDVENQ